MRVELVTRTQGVGKYRGLSNEEIVAAIARHGVIKEDNGKLVKYLLDNKHVSPLDMINFGFEIETSLSIGRQLLRHASIKPQEHSLRYSKSVGFEPIELRQEDKKNRQSSTEVFDPVLSDWHVPAVLVDFSNEDLRASNLIQTWLDITTDLYNSLLEAGVAKECARFILPNCTTTVMTFNGSLRSWLSLLNVRCDHHAQKECQEIARLVGEELEQELPNVFSRIDWKNGMFL